MIMRRYMFNNTCKMIDSLVFNTEKMIFMRLYRIIFRFDKHFYDQINRHIIITSFSIYIHAYVTYS